MATQTGLMATARRMAPEPVAKPWGRRRLGAWGLGVEPAEQDQAVSGDAIGEIHHHLPGVADLPLMVKTLFTSQRLSVQVHPDAATARAAGENCGKDEAWVVLAAEPGATIGLGLRAPADAATLRAAAIDGSIVDMLHWHACAAGDVFFAPAGTIHAIGAGVTLFEFQQNLDVTYRLFDYGRGRPLHLEQGLAVACAEPVQRRSLLRSPGKGRELLVEGPAFVLERVRVGGAGRLRPVDDQVLWVAVAGGEGRFGDAGFAIGEVWHLAGETPVAGEAELLVAYLGASAVAELWLEA